MAKIIPFPQQRDDMFLARRNSELCAGFACAEILIFTGSKRNKAIVRRRSARNLLSGGDFNAKVAKDATLKLVVL
ncbi:MAG: hypothetical protein H7X92_08270 [Chitinophagales bacterium]|nr:hypothetical protein [Hyphomicrobiales bacterium]